MMQFKTKKSILVSGKYILIYLFANSLYLNVLFGQQYSSPRQLDAVVYDRELTCYDFDSIVRKSETVICVIGTSCSGCVEYFANKRIVKTFVYFVDDLSIMEMNRACFLPAKPGIQFYFALKTKEAESLFSKRSPQLLHSDGSVVTLQDYTTLDRLTNGFTLAGKKAKKQLHIH